MVFAWVCAGLTGAIMPLWAVLMGNLMDATDNNKSPEQMWYETKLTCLIIGCSGFMTWTLAALQFTNLLIFSEKVARRIRVAYLKAIFN
jgi:hypothetical protein